MTRMELYGFPGWVGAITSPTKCAWWAADPAQLGWDPQALHGVDLAMTPSAALAGRIKPGDVQVDDHTSHGGRTTIGPLWPGGTMIGACWIPADVWKAMANPPPRAPVNDGGRDYEHTAVQYFDNEQGNRRFYGFHAKLAGTPQGGLTLLEVWNPGTSIANPKPAGSWWLDLAKVADPGGPTIDPATPEGPIFLEHVTVRSITMFQPKLPPSVGAFGFPRREA